MLFPDLRIAAHISDFLSDSKRSGVVLTDDSYWLLGLRKGTPSSCARARKMATGVDETDAAVWDCCKSTNRNNYS